MHQKDNNKSTRRIHRNNIIRVVILVKIKGVFARIEVNTAVGKLCHQLITQ